MLESNRNWRIVGDPVGCWRRAHYPNRFRAAQSPRRTGCCDGLWVGGLWAGSYGEVWAVSYEVCGQPRTAGCGPARVARLVESVSGG